MKNMRLALILTTAFLLSFGFSSCKKVTEPKDVAANFYEALQKNDVDKAITYLYFEEDADKEEVDALKEKYVMLLAYTEGVKSFEVLEQEIDGETATVKMNIVMGNGEENDDVLELIQVNNEWKIKP